MWKVCLWGRARVGYTVEQSGRAERNTRALRASDWPRAGVRYEKNKRV